MLEITLYSTGCPQCIMVENKLKEKNINYTKNSSVEEIQQMGFTKVPIMKVDDTIMSDILVINKFIKEMEV